MTKHELAPGIVHYIFDPKPGRHFAVNLTAIVDGNKALLIDTAYEDQLSQLLEEFAQDGIEIAGVIISHFHDDHMEGLKLLLGIPVYGSSQFQTTLDLWTDKAEHSFYTPTITVDAPMSFQFGGHSIKLIPQPGHSACTMLTIIDDKFIQIGDEIMFAADGTPLLPCSDMNILKRLLGALDKLRAYTNFTLIPSHGDAFSGDSLLSEIDNRYSYLQAVDNSDGTISYTDATKDCTCDFAHSEWHENNCYRGE